MKEAGLLEDPKLVNVKIHFYFFVALMLSETQKKKEDANYVSPHQAYLDILPSDTNDFPTNYTEEEMALLQGTNMPNYIEEIRAKEKAVYNYICVKVPEMKKYAFKDFHSFFLLTRSRAFQITLEGKMHHVMVPYGDMLNHKEQPETKWGYDNANKCFTIWAL